MRVFSYIKTWPCYSSTKKATTVNSCVFFYLFCARYVRRFCTRRLFIITLQLKNNSKMILTTGNYTIRHAYSIRMHIMSHGAVAVITVVMRVQSALKTVVFSKRKMLYSTIQIILDQALFSNTNNPLFWDSQWIDRYNRMVYSYGTFNYNEQTAQLRFDR